MTEEQGMSSMGGCLARVFWILVGPGLLLICLAIIWGQKIQFPSWLDAVYASILLLIIVARILDKTKKADPRPIIIDIAFLILFSGIFWVLAHFTN